MSTRISHLPLLRLVVFLTLGLAIPNVVLSHEGHGSPAPRRSVASEPEAPRRSTGTVADAPKPPLQPRFGGQVSTTRWHYFEVVYTPQDVRVFVYSLSQQPLDVGQAKGELTLQVLSTRQVFRYPLISAATADGFRYLSATVDLSRVRDGDMAVFFDVRGVPLSGDTPAQFQQTFALTRPPLLVRTVQLTAADQPFVARQRMCPVMDASLTDHGPPIKLLVGEQPLYVCCDSCIAEVQKNPRGYLQKAAAYQPVNQVNQNAPPINTAPPAPPRMFVNYAVEADRPAAMRQGRCPVTGQPLGPNAPLKIVLDGRELYVCCANCVREVEQNPAAYFGPPAPLAASPVASQAVGRAGIPLPSQFAQPTLIQARTYDEIVKEAEANAQRGCPPGGCSPSGGCGKR